MLEYGRLFNFNSQAWPPLLQRKVTIPAAQVLTSFSTPVIVITNALILLENFVCHKPAGIAYTIAGVTNVGLRWTIGGTSINAFAPGGILDSATAVTLVMRGAGSSVSLFTGIGAGQFGSAIEFACSGANPAAGTSDFTYWLSFRVWNNGPLAY